MLSVLALFSIFLGSSLAQDADLLFSYDNYLELNAANPQYDLYWTVDGDTISFAVRVETNGWIGFGISPDGRMLDSDVIQGFVGDATNQSVLVVSSSTYVHNIQ